MSLKSFQQRIRAASICKAEQQWFPKWVDGYRQHCRLEADQDLPVTETLVIGFLRSLRDNRVEAWRRLQAARAIELYQEIIPAIAKFDFAPIKRKLHGISKAQDKSQTNGPQNQREKQLVPGEWNPGKLDATESKIIRRMRGRMRVLGHRRSTEKAYIGWIRRFIRTVKELLGHKDVKTTEIYTHVMNRPGLAVRSPADRMLSVSASPK